MIEGGCLLLWSFQVGDIVGSGEWQLTYMPVYVRPFSN
jgi:hypothetical protein